MASVMELMRELKHLGELRKTGQLTPEQEQRLKDIKAVLDTQMARNSSAPKPAPAAPPGRAPLRHTDVNPQGDPNAFKLDLPDDLAGDLAKAAEKADAVLKAQKSRPRARNADEAVQQLTEINRESQYTPPEVSLGSDDYFGYAGYEAVPDVSVELPLIDPRTVELSRMSEALSAPAEDGTELPSVMPGGVFLDDFMELYTNRILLADDIIGDDEEDANDPSLLIGGKRKVTVHMVNGEVKRGIIQRMGRNDLGFTLMPQGAGRPESISLQQIKAIFVSLNPGATPPAPAGRNVTVMFKDRRSIQGATNDLGAGPSFTLIPPPGRGGFEKIIINQSQCQEVR